MGGITTNGYSSDVSIFNKKMDYARAAPFVVQGNSSDVVGNLKTKYKDSDIKCRNFGGSFVTKTN